MAIGPEAFFKLFNEGQYNIDEKRSDKNCPDGNLVHVKTKVDKKQENILLLGSRINFNLNDDGKKIEEQVPESCLYQFSLKLQNDGLTRTTTKTKCVDKKENGKRVEQIKKTSQGYIYSAKLNQDKGIQCFYKREKS
jgi:hypothetical protein